MIGVDNPTNGLKHALFRGGFPVENGYAPKKENRK